MYHMNKWINID